MSVWRYTVKKEKFKKKETYRMTYSVQLKEESFLVYDLQQKLLDSFQVS